MPSYNEDHRNAFLELATEVGPHRARERLGYPGARTATRWMQEAGLDWSKAPDAVLGRALRQAYSDGDLLSVGAALLDELVGNLTQGVEHETTTGAVVGSTRPTLVDGLARHLLTESGHLGRVPHSPPRRPVGQAELGTAFGLP